MVNKVKAIWAMLQGRPVIYRCCIEGKQAVFFNRPAAIIESTLTVK